jgi:hypothetical protein
VLFVSRFYATGSEIFPGTAGLCDVVLRSLALFVRILVAACAGF